MGVGGLPDGETVGGIYLWMGEGDEKIPEVPTNLQILQISLSWDSTQARSCFVICLFDFQLGHAASAQLCDLTHLRREPQSRAAAQVCNVSSISVPILQIFKRSFSPRGKACISVRYE